MNRPKSQESGRGASAAGALRRCAAAALFAHADLRLHRRGHWADPGPGHGSLPRGEGFGVSLGAVGRLVGW